MLRPAKVANARKINRDIYRSALHAQSASNISGLFHSMPNIMQAVWDEAHSIGEGTDFANTHPVVCLMLHQMAHLSKTNFDLLGDKWAEYERLCTDLTGDFRADGGTVTVIEVSTGFTIIHNPSSRVAHMSDCVGKYCDESGAEYHVGTPEFYEMFRADVRDNWREMVEAYFPEEAAHDTNGPDYRCPQGIQQHCRICSKGGPNEAR